MKFDKCLDTSCLTQKGLRGTRLWKLFGYKSSISKSLPAKLCTMSFVLENCAWKGDTYVIIYILCK